MLTPKKHRRHDPVRDTLLPLAMAGLLGLVGLYALSFTMLFEMPCRRDGECASFNLYATVGTTLLLVSLLVFVVVGVLPLGLELVLWCIGRREPRASGVERRAPRR